MEENSLLSLNTDVFGPLDKTSEIPLWLDVSTDSKVTSIFLEQGALNILCTSFASSRGSDNFLAFSNFLDLHDNTIRDQCLTRIYLP